MLVNGLSPLHCGDVLDGIAARITAKKKPSHWRAGNNLSTTVHRLAVKALKDGSPPEAERLWSWIRSLEGTRCYSTEDREYIRKFFERNPTLRREVQKHAFGDRQIDGAPWMAIVHDLPSISAGLTLTIEDAAKFLAEIASKETLSNFDIDLWASLVRSKQSYDGLTDEVQGAVGLGTERHAQLQQKWEELTLLQKRIGGRNRKNERRNDKKIAYGDSGSIAQAFCLHETKLNQVTTSVHSTTWQMPT